MRDLTQSQDSQLTTKDGPVVKDGEYVEISHSQSYNCLLYTSAQQGRKHRQPEVGERQNDRRQREEQQNGAPIHGFDGDGNQDCLLYTSRCV